LSVFVSIFLESGLDPDVLLWRYLQGGDEQIQRVSA
jgi:hypothetical protein